MRDALDFLQLERYFAGESSPEERARLTAWINANPERRSEIEQLRTMFAQSAVADGSAFDARAALSRIQYRRHRTPSVQASRLPTTSIWRASWLGGLAAVLVVGLAFETGGFLTHNPHTIREFSTAPGNHATLTLLDGTRVTLGPATRLSIPTGYGATNRTVDLDGEAYFSVVHNERHPFAVLANNVTITDVGTEFDVRAYPADNETRVAVARGAVALVGAGRGNGATGYSERSFDLGTVSRTRPTTFPTTNLAFVPDIPLSAGDLGMVSARGIAVTHRADLAPYTDWVQGRLVFDDTPLREVVRDIGRAYGVEIQVADTTLTSNQITTAFDRESLEQVLDEVTSIVGADYVRTGQVIVIHRKPARAIERQQTPITPMRVVARPSPITNLPEHQ